jgi:hypothetical protein
VASSDYRVLALRVMGEDRVHLVGEDAEAALCGVPRSHLGPGAGGELVCEECLEWLARRKSLSNAFPKVKRPS